MKRTLLSNVKLKFIEEMMLLTRNIPGDIAEIGVYKGGGLKFICGVASTWGKNVYGYDTFEGLPEPGELDLMEQGKFSDTNFQQVQDFVPEALVVKGTFPEAMCNESFSFVHLDIDFYEGTRKSLAAIWPLLTTGGIVVLDDVGYSSTPGVTLAVYEFIKELNCEVYGGSYQLGIKKI